MALAAQQSLLDELMGKGRNAAKGEKVHKCRFDDPNVCKYMLVDFCPHDLFVNTRQDLGLCDKIHDINLQNDYQSSSRYGKLGYEDELERFLKSLISDVERRIKRGQERLRLTQGDPNNDNQLNEAKNETLNKIKCLEEKITTNIFKSEQLGNDCRIDEAQQILNECEDLREEKKKLETQLMDEQSNSDSTKAMEVCAVCGSFLIVGDIQSRLDEHANGKQHTGYAKIRASLEELIRRRSQLLDEERLENSKNRESSNRKRERSHSKEKISKRQNPSSHHHHLPHSHDKNTKQRDLLREKTDHHRRHHNHRSSRHDDSSSSNHRHYKR